MVMVIILIFLFFGFPNNYIGIFGLALKTLFPLPIFHLAIKYLFLASVISVLLSLTLNH